MNEENSVVVVGLGEVGRPLFEVLSRRYTVVGVDIAPPSNSIEKVDVLHVCYPFEIKDFVGETARYIELFKPALTVINSTVAVGTTRTIGLRTGTAVAHSPVRGKHVHMLAELGQYTKFIGATDAAVGKRVAAHFEAAGLKTEVLSTPEASELAKLTETTYFGLLIAWAQEVERYCDQSGASYEEIISFYEEISFFPSTKYFSGIIGGHCVMPNIEILSKFDDSQLLRAIQASNRAKIEREATKKSNDQAASVSGSRH
jgi:UDP-N-acetyl-D-mannosaminuronate dehydrogenase